MPIDRIIKYFLEHSNASGSRSTVLKSISWLIGLLLPSTIVSSYLRGDSWLTVALFILLFVSVLIFFFAFIYFMFHDKDALRSEKFIINKLAIEKGVYGDSKHGLVQLDEKQYLISETPHFEES